MDQNKNTSSKLDGLFENARKEQPLMDLNEVSNLIQNPAAYQKKRESNVMRWFGVFLLIGLSAFGTFILLNNNADDNKKTVAAVAESKPVVETIKAASNDNAIETEVPAALENNSKENLISENSEDKKKTETVNPALTPGKTKSNTAVGTKHYVGDATISFSSDNKKIKMTISPSNEIESLTVNDELISNESYKDYKNIIDEGLKLKNEKIKSGGGSSVEEPSISAAKRTIMNEMLKELTTDGLISSDQPFDFTLTGQELILNNQKQSPETFEKYKDVYEKVTGEKLPTKYNLHIKR
ncbi:MAG: hypothetical protein ABI855_00215 [Bacteroidota bacterium]